MTLALFDLDNTLIGGDSDQLWGDFLVDRGYVDARDYRQRNHQFYRDYLDGTLDIFAYLRFCLQPLAENEPETLARWHAEFMRERIAPILLPKAAELIEHHRSEGHRLLVITATNRFITEPIVRHLGIDELLATEPQRRHGRFTGEVEGTPTFREGKVTRLQQWLHAEGENLAGSWFYSDSHNDLPLLEKVANPVAVDPDDALAGHAEARGWPVISLR